MSFLKKITRIFRRHAPLTPAQQQARAAKRLMNRIFVDDASLDADVGALIDAGADVHYTDRRGDSLLHDAVRWSSPVLVGKLVAAGADPDLKNKRGRTPLSLTSRYNARSLIAPMLKAGGTAQLVDASGKVIRDFAKQVEAEEKEPAKPAPDTPDTPIP